MSVTITATTSTGRQLRLLPAPRPDGPYDDERSDPPPFVDGNLALAFPSPTRSTMPLRLVPPAAPPPPELGSPLPDPRAWSVRLAQALAEVLAGARPAHQLADATTLEVLHQLERNAGRLGEPLRGPAIRPRLRSIRLCQPRTGVAEVCAVIDTGSRQRALAFRLVAERGRWRCAAVTVG